MPVGGGNSYHHNSRQLYYSAGSTSGGDGGVESVGPSDVPADLSRDKMRGSSYMGGGGGEGLERV